MRPGKQVNILMVSRDTAKKEVDRPPTAQPPGNKLFRAKRADLTYEPDVATIKITQGLDRHG